jgi:DNA-directed RNA polymerase specialized sigma24 family protein
MLDQAIAVSDRGEALSLLNADQQKRLSGFARLLAVGMDEPADDLLSRAHLRWLESNEAIEGPDRTFEFLCGAMRSIRFNFFQHQKVAARVGMIRAAKAAPDDPDPIETVADPASSQEDTVYAQQLYDLCAVDCDVQTFIMYEADQATRRVIQAEMGWDDKKYDAIRKRRLRMVARWKLEGKLP